MAVDALDRRRYRKVRRFFAGVLLHALWWDVALNRPGLRWLRKPAMERWRRIAREFRALALEMGGVLIKLGQFLSIRVDILPLEIIGELAGLQDQVPPAPIGAVLDRVRADFGGPVSARFSWISPEPVGSASLAQVHRAKTVSGETVVIKVLRPGIRQVVETDLAALRQAFRWLKAYRKLRERVDLDWLFDEFAAVTRKELDLLAEGRNAERLEKDLAESGGVCFPCILWNYSGTAVLAMSDVGYLKIDDLDGLARAGISRVAVADRLYAVYMRQVFETHFVHVDPHPGNLFIRPLPCPDESAAGRARFAPGEPVPHRPDRPFEIVFLDFGMAVEIPERLRSALREYAIGLGTADVGKIMSAYRNAGTLLPGADLERLREAHEALFERFWGVGVGRLKDLAMGEAKALMHEYRDVIQAAPFQFQADMLFVVRAVGMLSGLAAYLDPEFDVWSKTLPYARRYAREAMETGVLERGLTLLRMMLTLPERVDGVLSMAAGGRLQVVSAPSPDLRRRMARLERSVDLLGRRVVSAALLVAAAILHTHDPEGVLWKGAALLALPGLFRRRE